MSIKCSGRAYLTMLCFFSMAMEPLESSGFNSFPNLELPECATESCRACAAQNSRYGLRQYLDIQPQRPLVDVLQVQFHPLFKRDRVAPVNLPKAGDPGLYAEPASVTISVEHLIVAKGHGSRTHKAHFSLQDI